MPASVKSKDLSGEIGWRLDELEDKFCDFLRLAQTVGGNLPQIIAVSVTLSTAIYSPI